MLKKLLLLPLFLLTFTFSAYSNSSSNLDKFNANIKKVAEYYSFMTNYIKDKKLDPFVFVNVHRMFVISRLYSNGTFCIAAFVNPALFNEIARIDESTADILRAICLRFPSLPLDFIQSQSGVLRASNYVFYFDKGVIVRIDVVADRKLSIIPADIKSFFDAYENDFSKLFENEYIVTIELAPGLKAVYKARPTGELTEILDVSALLDIRRNFSSVANISLNELVLYLREYYNNNYAKNADHFNSVEFFTNFMTSSLHQERFVTWVTQKFNNAQNNTQSARQQGQGPKDRKDKAPKERGVRK